MPLFVHGSVLLRAGSGAIQAVALVGGLGTRVADLYPAVPKALIPVGGKPFVSWLIEWLKSGGIESIHLAAGHLAKELVVVVDALAERGECVTISKENRLLGTAGALKFAENYIRTDPFLVVNGDTMLPRLDFSALARCHLESDALVTITVTKMEQAGQYGTVKFDDGGRLTAFREKEQNTAGWVNGGAYVVDAGIMERIELDVEISLETDVFPRLASEGAIQAFPTEPPLLDMGTPNGLVAMDAYLRGHVAERRTG